MAERDPRGSLSTDEILAQILALKLELRRVRVKLSGADSFDPAQLAAELRAISEAFAEFAAAIEATETEDQSRPADSLPNK